MKTFDTGFDHGNYVVREDFLPPGNVSFSISHPTSPICPLISPPGLAVSNSQTNVSDETLVIKVKYFSKEVPRLNKIDKGDWIDLTASESIELNPGDHKLIPLGIAVKLPDGYEAHIAPRSSTFKNFGVLQTNSVGVVDETYCGDNDQWFMSVYATRRQTIYKGDRICQFRIMKKMPVVLIEEVDMLNEPDRGGHGSTGIN